jgi:xanthine dehydrogenase small subunit
MPTVRVSLNGVLRVADQGAPTTTVLDWLRGSARLTGTKEGCAEGDCGACTILVSGSRDDGRWRAVNSCLMLVPQVDSCAVLTVEGVARR